MAREWNNNYPLLSIFNRAEESDLFSAEHKSMQSPDTETISAASMVRHDKLKLYCFTVAIASRNLSPVMEEIYY